MATLFMFLGPDRVGKTTTVNKTAESMVNEKPKILHFSGPEEWHTSLFDQYEEIFSQKSKVVICDRGIYEAAFYESFRRNLRYDLRNFIQEVNRLEKILRQKYRSGINIYMIREHWANVESRHITELKLQGYEGDKFYAHLDMRYREHEAYYAYMDKLRDQFTLDIVDYVPDEYDN